MAKTKTAEIKSVILELLTEQPEVSIRSIAPAAELSPDSDTDRKAIQRALAPFERQKTIIPKGERRARVYVLSAKGAETVKAAGKVEKNDDEYFEGITLSPESERLLKDISQPIEKRTPVGCNLEFLELYEPNKSFYLSDKQREELLSVGRVEMIERPAGTYARNILDRLLIDLSWNSSRLEGNTYSLLETKRLIELGEEAAGKNAAEAQMILNHKAAIEYIVGTAEDKQITTHDVRSVHALLSDRAFADSGKYPKSSERTKSARFSFSRRRQQNKMRHQSRCGTRRKMRRGVKFKLARQQVASFDCCG